MTAGGCTCGAVRYKLIDAPIMVNCCRCRDCQRITGSAFALNGMIETEAVVVTHGAPEVRTLERDGAAETRAWRCPTCEALLWADHPRFGDAARFVRLGTLDEAERFAPDAHFFVRSRHPWVAIPAAVPQFATLPGEGEDVPLDPERAERMAALPARSARETKGG